MEKDLYSLYTNTYNFETTAHVNFNMYQMKLKDCSLWFNKTQNPVTSLNDE